MVEYFKQDRVFYYYLVKCFVFFMFHSSELIFQLASVDGWLKRIIVCYKSKYAKPFMTMNHKYSFMTMLPFFR